MADSQEGFMTRLGKVGLAVGAAMVLGGLAVGAATWAQESVRFERQGRGGGFQFAGSRDFGHGQRMGARILAMLDNDRVKSALGLTDDQTSRLRQIVVDTQKGNITTGAELTVRGIELRELLRADNPDQDAVMKKIDQISALRAQVMKQDVEALLKAKTVLTPEQQKKIRTFIERRRAGGAMGGGGFGWRSMNRGGRRFGAPTPGNPGAPAAPKSPDAPQQQP
jgi:Spy/CpxP family protein refolding chaperone